MNTRIAIATTLIAFAGAGSAFAQEGTQDFADIAALSTQSRAVVRAELMEAQHAGHLYTTNEASPTPVPASTLSRTQVLAELREATRLGVVGTENEGEVRIATPAEQQAIRLAGERAVDAQMARRAN